MSPSKPIDAGRRAFLTQSTQTLLCASAAPSAMALLSTGPVPPVLTLLSAGLSQPARAASPRRDAASTHLPSIAPQAIESFLDAVAAGKFELHSLIIARHGQIAAGGWYAPYRAASPHLLYSLSKSFTSTAVGFAVAEGKLRLTDKVIDFFPGQTPPTISENLAALTVEHLLTMSVGQPTDATPIVTREHDWVKTFLQLPIQFKPGSVFLYNSAATYMLSAILQKVTGQQVNHYLRPRFFAPLEIPEMTWQECPLGINTGGWGLSATTETLSKFGQFYLQQGRWNGRQLLSSQWISQATRLHILQTPPAGKDPHTDDWYQGYGFQFWRCRHNAFRGDGAFGQFCIVLPEQDAVIAMTSRTTDMQGLLNLAWDHLLAGMTDPTSPEQDQWQKLHQRLAGLTLSVPVGAASAGNPDFAHQAVPGAIRPSPVYSIEPNPLGITNLSVSSQPDALQLAFEVAGKTHTITSGLGAWHDNETALPGTPPEWTELIGVSAGPRHPAKVAVAGAWKDPQTFEMQWRYYETPHFDTVTLHFSERRVEVTFLNSMTQMSASLHSETRPVLEGLAST